MVTKIRHWLIRTLAQRDPVIMNCSFPEGFRVMLGTRAMITGNTIGKAAANADKN